MRTKIVTLANDCWQALTEVPGWPDAPTRVRFRRVLPLLIPCVVMLLLSMWNKGVRDPHRQNEKISQQALLAQDNEIETLRLTSSDRQADEVAARAAQVARLILNEPQELEAILQGLKKEAADRHWDGTFQASDLSISAATPDKQLIFLPARAKLTSGPGNADAYSGLLVLLERVSASGKRIDLTRLAIRADEKGRYMVELNLRLIGRSPHEKITQ